MTDVLALADWTWAVGVLALAASGLVYALLARRPAGTPAMAQLAQRIRSGGVRVLGRGSFVLGAGALGAAALIVLLADAHPLALAETLGDPWKDSCAPTMSSLIKLMSVLALVLAPWLAAL
ncbi:MAG: hypothetical protein EXR95_04660 [Gemmatimonadetes bacterium]|nr:hypothetical protein [Gemmatimonadota bacterium]